MKEFGIDFNNRDEFHDFLILTRNVRVKSLLIFVVDFSGFTFGGVVVKGLRLIEFGFIEERRLIWFIVANDNILAFGLLFFD